MTFRKGMVLIINNREELVIKAQNDSDLGFVKTNYQTYNMSYLDRLMRDKRIEVKHKRGTTREALKTEEVFYDQIFVLVRNLLINNINYKNGHYTSMSCPACYDSLLKDTIDRAEYILNRMEETKHLIDL